MRKMNIEKTIYLSEDENEKLQQKCKELNLNQSQYFRKLITDFTPKKYNGDAILKQKERLEKISDKIRKVLSSLETIGYASSAEIRFCFTEFNSILKDILNDSNDE